MNGRWQQRNSPGPFQDKIVLDGLAVLLLVGLGATAILLRTHLRIPLGIPGRSGILVMLFFMAGRSLSEKRIAGLYSALGASAFLLIPGIGPKDPWLPLIFIVLGVVLDYSLYMGHRLKANEWLLVFLAGGIAYAMIPLSRLVIHCLTGFPYTEFIKHGYYFPIATHFFLGGTGSLFGAAPVLLYKYRQSKNE